MLDRSGLSASNQPPRRPVWGTDEWDLIVEEMQRQQPGKRFKRYDYPGFTLEDFEVAMESVIRQDKQQAFDHFDDIRAEIFGAFTRLYQRTGMPEPAPEPQFPTEGATNSRGGIYWSTEEWESVNNRLNELDPTLFPMRLKHLNIGHLRQAMVDLPPHRRKAPKQLVSFRLTALRAWDNAHEGRKVVAFTTGPIVEPPIMKSHAHNALATAMHDAFKAPAKEKSPKAPPKNLGKKEKHVFWVDADYLAIAREMLRQNPHANYLTSQLSGLEVEAVRAAQRVVIEPQRRRPLILSGTGWIKLKDKLRTAFAIINAEGNCLSTAKETPEVPIKKERLEVSEGPVDAAVKTADKELPNLNDVGTYVVDKRLEFQSALATAAAPLVDLLMSKVAEKLLPGLIQALAPEVCKQIMPLIQSAITQQIIPAAAPEKSEVKTFATEPMPLKSGIQPLIAPPSAPAPFEQPSPQIKPKKPLIIMVGPMGKQKNELEREFPDYRLMFVENGHMPKGQIAECELFIVMQKHSPQNIKQSAKTLVAKEKLLWVEGGISTIKREIETWAASNKK